MKKKKPDWFIYKQNPFRMLYLGGHFWPPSRDRRIWLIRDRSVARELAAVNHAMYADFRQYASIARGHTIDTGKIDRMKMTAHRHHRATAEELA